MFNPSLGDMDKLDPYVRRIMAQKLDPTTGGGADWRELGRRLGLGTLENALAIHSSPTTQVLAQYEVSIRLGKRGLFQNKRISIVTSRVLTQSLEKGRTFANGFLSPGKTMAIKIKSEKGVRWSDGA